MLFPFPQGLTPPELLVWISHSPFPEMAKDQEVLRLFGKLIGLPSHPRPESVLAPEAETFDVNGLVLDPALMALEQAASGQGAPSSAEPVVVKQNMRCDFVHPISKQRCPKGECLRRLFSSGPFIDLAADFVSSSASSPSLQCSRGRSTCAVTLIQCTMSRSPLATSARTARRGSRDQTRSVECVPL